MKRAFTLIELIFVIIIIGILGTIGTQIFSRIFEGYYTSKVQNDLESKTEIVLTQIVNRLSYRIKQSTIISTNGNAFVPLESAVGIAGGIYALEWIAYDDDSRRGIANAWNDPFIPPSWSGLIDLEDSNRTSIIDPALSAGNLRTTVLSLSRNIIDLNLANLGNNTAVIIYPDASGSVEDFGWYNGSNTLAHPVYLNGNSFAPSVANTFTGVANEVYEHYYLAHTAYAIEFDPATQNLMLYFNYRPWNAQTYINNGTGILLTENVTTFRLLQIGSLIKVQLCLGLSAFEQAAQGDNYSICKEKAVF